MLSRFLACRVLAVGLATMALTSEAAAQSGSVRFPRVTTVYVSAIDRHDAPVGDLTAKDFVLKEGGDIREIVKVEPATAPLHIAMIVDDSGTGIFRYPVASFVDRLLGRAQFAIGRVVGQVQNLVDYTSDVERLRTAVLGLGMRSETQKGGQVVEAVFQAARDLRQSDAERPVILVLTDTEAEYSSLSAQHVLDELQQSGAVMHVVAVMKRAAWNASAPTSPGVLTTTVAADKPSDLLERQVDINRVLGDGPKQSGGRLVEIAGLAGQIPELQQIAEELNRQYLITYIVPAGEKPGQKLNVSTKRRGISVRAPSRAGRGAP
jgi:VWFA-related protein